MHAFLGNYKTFTKITHVSKESVRRRQRILITISRVILFLFNATLFTFYKQLG